VVATTVEVTVVAIAVDIVVAVAVADGVGSSVGTCGSAAPNDCDWDMGAGMLDVSFLSCSPHPTAATSTASSTKMLKTFNIHALSIRKDSKCLVGVGSGGRIGWRLLGL
jgi:hypothetical protein